MLLSGMLAPQRCILIRSYSRGLSAEGRLERLYTGGEFACCVALW